MYDYREKWKKIIAGVMTALFKEAGINEEITINDITAEIPPEREMGDLAFPMFGYAKSLRKSPAQIAEKAREELEKRGDASSASAAASGPYLNIKIDRGEAAKAILSQDSTLFGKPETLQGQKIMVEYSSPNTNKPLHLGHLRNDVLGESTSRILAACGAEVRRVCIINDRGIHICKSMLSYMEQGEGKTPESEGIKSDHFVGDWYVKFSQDLKQECDTLEKQGIDKKDAEAQAPSLLRAQELLRLWEAGDEKTTELWKKMNAWAFDGWQETYRRTGVKFDKYYYESQTYLLGKDEILKGVDRGIFVKEEDGSVQVDLSAEKLDKKVLLRRDGTSLYIVQDIGTAILRYNDWNFDRLVYVVASEQNYHFKVLFTLLKKLGFSWTENLFHLSYGMVNLPEGKMKSREGTVVDADVLLDSLKEMALEEIRDKEREEAVGDADGTAEKVALGALHYYLLHVSPSKDMLFDPKESLSFNGNTGPYLQYMGARISSILRRAGEGKKADDGAIPAFELLTSDAEWELIETLGSYNDTLSSSAAGMDPSLLAAYLYDLAKAFSTFYHDCPILNAPDPAIKTARLALCKAVLMVLKNALNLSCIPFLDVM